ncbi:MAG: hypothetical protein ACJ72S_18460 [Nitrososphaeraceae archaeon]
MTSTLASSPSSPIDKDIKKGSLSDNAILGEHIIPEIEQAVGQNFLKLLLIIKKQVRFLLT